MPATKSTKPSRNNLPPALGSLGKPECEELLARNIVGRLAFALHDHVSIVPVNYVFEGGSIYGRTQPGGKLLDIVRNRRVAFEIDEPEGMFIWRSVIVQGSLYLIEPDGNERDKADYFKALMILRRLIPATMTDEDPMPFRSQVFRIQPLEISGRVSTIGGERMPPFAPAMRDQKTSPESDAVLFAAANAVVDRIVSPASRVHVDAFDDVVVLTGTVATVHEKSSIEREILALGGVRAVVQQIETLTPGREQHGPAELARDALRELQGADAAGTSSIKIVVDHDWIRAAGDAANSSVKEDSLRRLRTVRGARGVIDGIRLTARHGEG